MKRCLVEKWLTGPLLVGALMAAQLPAQDAQTAKPPVPDRSAPGGTASASAGEENGKIKAGETAATKYSVGIDEILKMEQAGISKEVIKTYIDNSPIPYNLSASDLIALKERGVTDDLTTALMKRGAVVRAQANQAAVPGSAEPRASASGASLGPDRRGHLDPEGYDYFWYYYLYPRTLASANQRFYSSGAPLDFYPYSYGYYQPAPFRPLPFHRP
jgi:hypothetical protein